MEKRKDENLPGEHEASSQFSKTLLDDPPTFWDVSDVNPVFFLTAVFWLDIKIRIKTKPFRTYKSKTWRTYYQLMIFSHHKKSAS